MKHRQARLLHRLAPALLVAMYVAYIVAVSAVAMSHRTQIRTIFELEYDFGPLVYTLVTSHVYASPDLFWTGHRMPLIPGFLALIPPLTTEALPATVIKNLVWFSLLVVAFRLARTHLVSMPPLVLLLVVAYFISFPQIVQYASLPDVEEGYLIPLLAVLFVALFCFNEEKLASNWSALLLLATLNGGLFLIKSSMLYLSLTFGLVFGVRTRSWRVLGLFLGFAFLSGMLWGILNLEHSGRFTLASSYDGLNLYKGNSPMAISLYPPYNLDIVPVGELKATTPPPLNEWTLNRHATVEALRFVRSHPLDALHLLLRRWFVFFLEVRRTPIWQGELQVATPLQHMGVVYMLIFRVAFFASIGYEALRLMRFRRSDMNHLWDEFYLFVSFLVLVLVYAAPYLAGFAYERHVLPLVLPTLVFGLWLLDRRRQVGQF